MEIQHYISELLSEHDCVIIPGLGGFVGSYLPAQIHPVYHTFQPPSKKILFNINLRQNDGLLANYIAQTEKVSFSDANDKIRQFAEETISVLKTRKYLILQDVGKIYMGKERNIQFDQDLRSNHLPESYGLEPFFSAPVKRDPYQEKMVKRQQTRRETKELVKRALPKPLKWAAILAIPIAGAMILSLAGYDSIKSGSWDTADIFSSLSPFSKADKREASPQSNPSYTWEEEQPMVEEVQGDLEPAFGPVRNKLESSNQSIQEEKRNSPVTQTVQPGNNTYAVIVGAFGIENNAHRLVSNLNQKGIKAKIFDFSSGGLARVSAGVFSSQAEAIRLMRTMKSSGFPGAWILEK